mgnify:CR=1 FL=1
MKELTDEQQQIIREAAETAKQYAREQSDERIASKDKDYQRTVHTKSYTLSEKCMSRFARSASRYMID